MNIEYTYTTEAAAKTARRAHINAGASVSLIGYDSTRNVYAYDVLGHDTAQSSTDGVSREQAGRVLEAVKALFPGQEAAFTLYGADHEDLSPGCWSIAAEGVYEPVTDCWPMVVSNAAHEARSTPGHAFNAVFLEPLTHWALGIYPNH